MKIRGGARDVAQRRHLEHVLVARCFGYHQPTLMSPRAAASQYALYQSRAFVRCTRFPEQIDRFVQG
jgi:hypothetical protein